MEEALEQTAQTLTSCQSLLEVLTITRKRKIACNPALVGQNVHGIVPCDSGHIHISFAFYQLFLRIIGDFLLNNGVDS